ncbi:PKD domain-containing protein [Bacillus sp. 37MA]|uniref:RCC1 domain-containing protein n=1 Tax=Bacillus sp. 37MA TaxID=1132442 RepID=UPI00036864DA|nr:PKD domain-containing protein [Bacillus sp. 37MA]
MNHKLFQPIFFIITILCLFIPTLPASALDVNEPDIKKMSSWKNPKSTEFYTIGITKKDDYLYYSDWKVRVDNSEKGSMVLMRSKDNPEAGLTFAHPSQVSQWAGFFNGNKDYVGQQALTSIKQTFGSQRVDRAYSRDIARYSGAKIDITAGSYDENGYRNAIVEIKTTKYPEATLVPKVTTIEKGVPLSIKVSGKQFSPYKEELTWTLYADSTRLDGGTLSSSTLSKDVSRVFSSCGVKELKLTVTDEVQRSTVKTVNVNVTGCATPPPLGQPALTIEPSTQEIMVGDTASFTANYFDASGNKTVVTTHSGSTWSAVNSAVAQPGTKGQFVGNSVGTSEVSVTYSGLTAKATVIVSATPPEPEPEPIPNLDPEVEIQGPVVVRAGEEFCLHASASDRDGEIISYDWNYNAIGSLWGQTGCGLYYNKEGEKTVQVTVTDDAGGTASDTHTILVVPPTPIADFKQEGALKENRKWTVIDTTSTPKKFPIVEEKWTIEAVDPANNVPEILKYKGSLTEDKVIDLLMKKEGKYKVTRFVRNSYNDPDKNWNEKTVEYTVRSDEKPTADFATVTAKIRDDVKERPALSQTRVSVKDNSGSNDDFIGQRVWSYQFDSNNDSKFDSNDDDSVIFSDGNEETPFFDTNKVGKYKISLTTIEEFAQPTIEEFVTEADRRRDDTSDKPSSESVVEVKNIRPVVSYDVKGKKEIDLQLDAIDSPYTQAMIETAFNEEIVPKLDAEGYKINLEWLEKKTGSSVSKMALGSEHTSVILENGEVWSTGYNINGQLGNGTKTYSNVPVKMSLPVGRSAVSIAAGMNHTSVLLDNGEVWNVGDNFDGQLGDGTKTDRSIPTKMSLPAGRSAVSIAAGREQTSVILDNGEVWGAGKNGNGQLGNGATSNSSVPVRMILPSGRTATMITIGTNSTSVILDNGEVWGVGYNLHGQLGNGTTTNSLVLVKMKLPVDRHAVSIAAGGGSFMSVLLDNGEVWNIGDNIYGQIGIGSSLASIKDLTKMILPVGRHAVSIAAGIYQTNVTLDNGEVWSAGYNYTGALGDGTNTNAKVAVKMKLPAGRSAVSATGGFNRTSVTLDNGEVWSTGHNTTGQLGNGTTTDSKVPVKMTLPSRAAFSTGVVKDTKTNFGSSNKYLFTGIVSDKEVDTGAVSSSVIDAGGNFIGLGNLINKAQIESIVDANNGKGTYLSLNDNVNMMMGSVADYIIAEMNNKSDETTIDLQVGLDDTPYTRNQLEAKFNEILKPKLNDERIKANVKFIEKETNSYVSSIAGNGSSLIFVLEDGSAYGVGYNLYGELGVGSSAWIKKPVKINLPNKVISVSMSRAYSLFLLEDGSVYGGGQNSYGQLGTGNTTGSYVPVKMILPDKAKYIYAEPIGSNNTTRTFVILENGEAYSAGSHNSDSQKDTTPIKEQALPDKVKMVTSSGQNTFNDKTYFLLENGEVYEKFTRYSLNESGVGVYTPHFNKIDSLPSKVLKISTSQSHTLFLLDNGEVYGVGENATGALGNGEYGYEVYCTLSCTLYYKSLFESVPVKMQGLPSRVIDIGAGPLISYMKLQNNDIYGVGSNQGNQLGDNAMGESMDVEGAYAFYNQYIQTTPVKVTGIPSEVVFMEGHGGYIQDTSGSKSFITHGNNFFLLKTGKLYSPTTIQTGYYNLTDVNAIGKLNTTENILNSNGFDFVESKNILFGSVFSRQAMDSDKLVQSVLGADADFIGVGNSISKPSFDQVIQKNMTNGTFINDAPIDTTVNAMADYIIERVNHRINSKELYVTLDDTVTYKTVYSDYENDPLFSERWKYMHTPDVFENNMGVDPKAHKYLTLPIEQFTRVGKYQPLYSGRDNPVHWDNNAFDTYRLWAKDADNWFIYAHRKPIPDFSFTINNITGAYSVTNKALDLDKYSIEIGNGPGIRKQTFQWRVEGEKTWKAGLPTGNLEQKVYEVKNTVVDFQRRTESMIKKMDATGINKPPVAVFEPIPSVITVGQDILFKNLSWDPNGDPLTAQWAIKKKGEPDSTYTALSTDYEPTKNFTAQGEYIVRLIVKDPSNETDSTTRDIIVMANNTKPNAGFTYPNPVYIGDTIQIESAATDPDGDILSYTYTIEKQNGDTVTIQSGDPEMDSNGNIMLPADQFPSDLGKWIITQTVSDGKAEDTATGELTVLDQTIEGFVNHTQKWEENRQKYNFDRTGSANSPRTPDVFFPGEKFMLKANATNTADTVRVKIVGIPGYETVLTNNASDWTGSLWKDDMLKRFKNMDGETLTFEFTSTYSNGWIRTDKVNIIIDDDEYWLQHTTF